MKTFIIDEKTAVELRDALYWAYSYWQNVWMRDIESDTEKAKRSRIIADRYYDLRKIFENEDRG